MRKNNIYILATLASLLLHVLVLIALSFMSDFSHLLGLDQAEQNMANLPAEPIAFDLRDESQMPREFVETADEAAVEQPPQNPQFISDKNARAQDNYAGRDLPNGLSYSEGQSRYRTLAGSEGGETAPTLQATEQHAVDASQNRQNKDQAESEPEEERMGDVVLSQPKTYSPPAQPFNRDMLSGGGRSARQPNRPFSDDANWDNRSSSVEDFGGFSLNTYAWDFAPYLLYLKRRLQDHIYPPPAFYQMGAINGETLLRFRVHKDGALSDLSLIRYVGHKALMETSFNAVKGSSPFKPLPGNFPEKYLEITCAFSYASYLNQENGR